MAQTKLRQEQLSGGLDGWIGAGETWTYASADDPTFTFTVAADVTTKYSAGMKIKLTQGTVKYFIITAVSTYSGGNTTITVYGGTDYDLANSAISANAYSMMRSPQGFPMSPAKWTQTLSDTSSRTQASPSGSTYYNLGSLSLSVPIGSWHMFAQTFVGHTIAGNCDVRMGMSLSSSSFTSGWPMVEHNVNATTNSAAITLNTKKDIDFTSKTTVYLVAMTQTGGTAIGFYGSAAIPTLITATCAYL